VEDYRGAHSITNRLPSFRRIFSVVRDVRVSAFFVPTGPPQDRERYVIQESPARGYGAHYAKILLSYLCPGNWVGRMRRWLASHVMKINVGHGRQTRMGIRQMSTMQGDAKRANIWRHYILKGHIFFGNYVSGLASRNASEVVIFAALQ